MNLSSFLVPAIVLTIAWPAIAAQIHVFTDRGNPVREVPADADVTQLDAGLRLEDELAAGLPAEPEQAAGVVRQRLEQGGAALQRRMESAYQGVTEAWGLGVAKVPAVVVDHRYVIYGEPDVALALARIARYRMDHP
ncbi:TIGR03757 family integrating conjugative element protein [Pseudomonas chlororaphis]|uniref:TIGR03757 family integrating conjugative element protein n=1 Tax=Pseudomonas chlororaphis TaxID=587753 RepID=UPI00046F2A55|nr:TIGR03757 family integrating conjugative element protein [Pseudomonas chlororaphis]